ncbi:conserved hypothetical protein [Bacillus vallismortis]
MRTGLSFYVSKRLFLLKLRKILTFLDLNVFRLFTNQDYSPLHRIFKIEYAILGVS